MNKNLSLIIWLIVLILTTANLVLFFNKPKEIVSTPEQKIDTTSEQNFGGANFFMNNVSQCPNNVSVPEQFSCLYKLADATEKETDTLATKLVSQAPIRLQEMKDKKIGPVPFVYGGEDFLLALPAQVKKAQQARNDYIDGVCNLTSMTIYGGSGMDLEQNACKYYFTNEYLQILKSLEGGLTVIE